MDRHELAALLVLKAVADAGSFTRAAKRLNRAQSGVSQTISELEQRLGVPLVARTTRSLRLTDAGQALLDEAGPALERIEHSLKQIRNAAHEPAGRLRITALEHPAKVILIPAIAELRRRHPSIKVDLHVSDRKVDIVEGKFDAGVRFSDHMEKDMTAIPISEDIKACVVGSPAYVERMGLPTELRELLSHDCIGYRLPTHGERYRWLFNRDGKPVEVDVDGSLTVNGTAALVEAARAGLGLAYVFEPLVRAEITAGSLIPCLQHFMPKWGGYKLYYPHRRQKSAALHAFVEVLREQRKQAEQKPSVF
ncbi:LysR family transcriptional regulator [Nitratireductor basaltis]|uniref:Transcriptional regulator n=1 Tax=Nitratireductor basaltis TaxID=472175 RepID=A0A084UEA9_9HYPH|nr:LysR family transcriptional regulator [Nitratireductor basaltis]KFB11295.1 Transcriptional regulator [Nitratireductor basaltis]